MPMSRRGHLDESFPLDAPESQVLDAKEERRLLLDLAACKANLEQALGRLPRDGECEPTRAEDAPEDGARLGILARRYDEIRGTLVLANLRLVAHVARGFRDRGVAHGDLMQEGICGLLEAIDRFDVSHNTKLATYATWWIRQAMQRAVAAGAYPVRLNPRLLRQLAQNQDETSVPHTARDTPSNAELIHHLRTATRPPVSLDAALDPDGQFSLLQTMHDPTASQTDSIETDEAVHRLMDALRPREQQVIALRFGLGGTPRLSLSQVGKALAVSKERVRQIQDRALAKLRLLATDLGLDDSLRTA